MKRRKRGKQTLKRKMLSILLLCAMSCILAVVIVSYMTIRMIQNNSIQESMQIYLEQITREIDSDYYDMIGIVNQMSPNGLIGNVTERYLSAEDNYDRYFEQKSLREELIKLGYVNTKLLGIAYYDPKEQKELIGNFNVRVLDPSYQTISKVIVGAENIIQAMHASYLGIKETPVLSVMRRVSFGNKRVLDIYAEMEPYMSVSDRLNKEKWPYTYMELDEKDKASVDFTTAVKLSPQDYDLLLNIYECYSDKNLSAEGDTYLQQALAINSDDTEDIYQKARIYYFLGEYDEAKAELNKMSDSQDARSMMLLSRVYMKQDDTAHARQLYQQYMDKYGETPEAYNGIVLCDIADADYDSALSNIEKGLALKEEKGKQDLYYNEIVVYEKKLDFETAKEKAGEYVKNYPSDEAGLRENNFLKTR